jgi:signal transduction histidine kinase
MKRSSKLGLRLALAFVSSMAAMAAICIVALVTLVDVSEHTRKGASQGVDLLRDAAAFDAMLYQKGFVADYMLTRDPVWLEKLGDARARFAHWIEHPRRGLDAQERELLREIERENAAYDRSRQDAVALFDSGDTAAALAAIPGYHVHINRLMSLSQRFSNLARAETVRSLWAAEHSIRRLAWLLVTTSLFGAISSLVVGFLWAQRIARPMYRLQLQIESAAERTDVRLDPSGFDLAELGEHVTALVQRVEAANAELAEQRRRSVQNEKLSAIGELATKLAHEILNPLAGMKAAVQLMAMQADASEISARELHATAAALEHEVTRIEQLVRRLLGYARPLAPNIQSCAVRGLIDAAHDAVLKQFPAQRWRFSSTEQPGIPALDVDPVLMTQVFVNLYRNAAEAMPDGGRIDTHVSLFEASGRREVRIDVEDEGPGIASDQLARLFTPFHSTKPQGHGLGLATSHNIVVEHGGTLQAHNREDRRGAAFRVSLPISR